jgi:hypothetical protein
VAAIKVKTSLYLPGFRPYGRKSFVSDVTARLPLLAGVHGYERAVSFVGVESVAVVFPWSGAWLY